jgi:Leucine-rich repeat (LRR) protein
VRKPFICVWGFPLYIICPNPKLVGNIQTLEDIDVSMNPLFEIPIAALKRLLTMQLKVFVCKETFIPVRPEVGRPAFFLADYFDYLQKFQDAVESGIYDWNDIELGEISEDIYYWPMKSMRSFGHCHHKSLETPTPIDLSVPVCPEDLLCEKENCQFRHPKKRKEDIFVDPIKVNAWSDKTFNVKLKEIHVPGTGVSKLWLLHRLVDLTIFNACGNGIRSLPPTISRLTSLTVLMLDRNPIGSLPIEFGAMFSLKSVSICGNQLKEFPDSVNNLIDLQNLALSRNFLRTFPVMPALSKLSRLLLDRNILVELPPTIFLGLNNLIHLDLSYNALNDLPATIGCLTKLQTCILNSNALQFIPKSFADLPNVTHLTLGRNMVCLFPKQLQGMKHSLSHLRINDCSIQKIPTWIRLMKAITEIFMDGTTISDIPDLFFELTALTTVSAERNRLDVLNPRVGKLSNLTHLSLSTNVIREIPLTLYNCTKLIHLALDSNNLCAVQRFVSRLAGLHELWLHRNQLTTLPRTICMLTNLVVLSVAFNEWEGGFFPQITSTLVSLKSLWLSEDQTRPYLPGWIKSCTNIVDLNVDFSIRKKPPFHVQKQGIETLFRWVLRIAKGSTSLDMDVSRFALASIPWFEACRTLRRIDISRNNVVTFYTDMQLPNLLELICNDNRIVEFTSAILNCPSLRVLLAWNNRLTSISLPICSLPKLQRLELQRNRLSDIPDEIGKLVSLLYLDLTSNQLTTMPTSMYQMTNLQSIVFEDNGLDTFLGPVVKQGVSIFLKYMESCFHVDMTQTIYLGHHGLASFPIHLCQQTSVTDLSLLRNVVTKVPNEVCWLRQLSKLSVRENKVKALPDSLTKCKITDLDIGMNVFDTMPPCLAKIFSLQRFIADNNLLVDLPDDFQYCGQVVSINLDQNSISKVPSTWKNIFSLKTLSLRFNNISDVGAIKNMTQIESLYLEGNTNLTQLDLDIGCLTSLTELYVLSCNVSKVSGAIAQCRRLKTVNFSGNKLSFLPEHFFSLKNIVCLALDDNRFSPIPDFHLLHSLEVLSFSNNPIPIMPSEFGLLVQLVDVTFSQCLIKRLPSHMASFLHLERFAMPMNELVAIPESLCECYRLQTLEFQHNKLLSVPLGMTKLTKLTSIYLHRNMFDEIPEVFFGCLSLKSITLHHCKLFVKKVPHKLDLEMLKDLKELIAVERLMHQDAGQVP